MFFKVHWMPSDSYPVAGRRKYADSWQKLEKIFLMKKVPPPGKTFFVYLKASRFASISARSSGVGPSCVLDVSAVTSCFPAIMDSRAALATSSTIARSCSWVCEPQTSIQHIQNQTAAHSNVITAGERQLRCLSSSGHALDSEAGSIAPITNGGSTACQ